MRFVFPLSIDVTLVHEFIVLILPTTARTTYTKYSVTITRHPQLFQRS